jgi:TatD DNase family protein
MNSVFLIDVHAHLQDEKFKDVCDAAVDAAISAGVKIIVNAGTCIETSRQAIDLAAKFKECRALVGIHPHDADKFNSSSLAELAELSRKPGVIGIGEIGLDFHYDFSPRATQIEVFKQLWQLAAELNLPAIIHVREAFPEFFAAIAALKAPPRVMLHCFSGDLEIARKALDLGFHFSVGGTLTYPKSETTREVFRHLPDSQIHLETDCPYLAPQPRRGRRNEPSFLPMTLEHLARVRQKSTEEMALILNQNARFFFGPGAME